MAIKNYLNFNVTTTPDPTDPKKTLIKVQTGPHGLFSAGLVMDIVIGVDLTTAQSLQHNNNPIPSPILAKALFDTGCTITSIDNSIITTLGLKTRGYAQTGTANGVALVTQHTVSLTFPGTNLKGQLVHNVTTVNLTGQPFQVLIGRDLMSTWSIHYNGPAGFVSISD